MCGDPGCYAVYFDGPDDPRVKDYLETFEGKDGLSLSPDIYQMVLLPYQTWLHDHDSGAYTSVQDL